MLVELREQLRDGQALDESIAQHPWWFSPAEAAMIRAARASGELPAVLRALAERHERSGELAAKLVGALTYPAVVLVVGLGVVVFLSVKTLPDLVGILHDAGIEAPALTVAIMGFGQGLLRHGAVGALALCTLCAGCAFGVARLRASGRAAPVWLRRRMPDFIRRAAVARAWTGLADLLRTGVPLVETLRLTAPTASGWVGGSLGIALERAAAAIERGSSFADALDDPVWFDDECRRLVAIGESAGELPEMLARLGERTHRAASRSIDRAASLLEPTVILLLAALIGVVVMGAVLPILKLQEIIG
jgi:type IV pilus assembly protein PilC